VTNWFIELGVLSALAVVGWLVSRRPGGPTKEIPPMSMRWRLSKDRFRKDHH